MYVFHSTGKAMLARTLGHITCDFRSEGEHMTVRAELAAVSGKAIAGFASYVRLSQHRQGHAGTYPRAHHLRLRVALQADHIQAARFQRHRYRLPLPAGSETLAASRRDRRRPPTPGMSRGHLQSGAMSSSRAQNRGSSPPRSQPRRPVAVASDGVRRAVKHPSTNSSHLSRAGFWYICLDSNIAFIKHVRKEGVW